MLVIFFTIFRESIPFRTLHTYELSLHFGPHFVHAFVVRHSLFITIRTLFESSIINHLCTEAPPLKLFIVKGKKSTPYATIKSSPPAASVKHLTALLMKLS